MMKYTNIFYRLPTQKRHNVLSFQGEGVNIIQIVQHLRDNENLDLVEYLLTTDVYLPLYGGKGGFGSLLRAIGAQIEKTTNKDSCRDLSGRRLRDVKREEELRKLIQLQEKLEEEQRKLAQEKSDKQPEIKDTPMQQLIDMFEDTDYMQRRNNLSKIVEAAVEKGILNISKSDDTSEQPPAKRVKKQDLWLGLEEEDTDDDKDNSETDEDRKQGQEEKPCKKEKI